METIEGWRAQIDGIDMELLRLFNLRAQIAIHIGRLKRSAGLASLDAAREQAVLARMAQANCGPLDNGAIDRLFRIIIQESREVGHREGYGGGPLTPEKLARK